jgi:UDP-glucose 4-epimerase
MPKKNILVTGSQGFIGKNLIRELNKQDAVNIFEASRKNGLNLSEKNWTKNLPEHEIDVVIHLAQSSNYRNFPSKADDIFKINIASTFELLEWCRKRKIKKFFLASSGNVYGDQSSLLKETSRTNPSSFYGVSKLAAEKISQSYQEFFQIIILRIFTVFGQGQKNMLIPNIINKIQNDEEITLAKNKGILFNPIFVKDFIKILIDLISKERLERSSIINIAGNNKVDLKKVSNLLADHIGKRPIFRITEDKESYFVADITKLKSIFDGLKFEDLNTSLKKSIPKKEK